MPTFKKNPDPIMYKDSAFTMRSGNSPVKADFFKGKTKKLISKAKSIAGKGLTAYGKTIDKGIKRIKKDIKDPVGHMDKTAARVNLLITKAGNPPKAAYEDIKHVVKKRKLPTTRDYKSGKTRKGFITRGIGSEMRD